MELTNLEKLEYAIFGIVAKIWNSEEIDVTEAQRLFREARDVFQIFSGAVLVPKTITGLFLVLKELEDAVYNDETNALYKSRIKITDMIVNMKEAFFTDDFENTNPEIDALIDSMGSDYVVDLKSNSYLS